jgi:hypothetical protein
VPPQPAAARKTHRLDASQSPSTFFGSASTSRGDAVRLIQRSSVETQKKTSLFLTQLRTSAANAVSRSVACSSTTVNVTSTEPSTTSVIVIRLGSTLSTRATSALKFVSNAARRTEKRVRMLSFVVSREHTQCWTRAIRSKPRARQVSPSRHARIKPGGPFPAPFCSALSGWT